MRRLLLSIGPVLTVSLLSAIPVHAQQARVVAACGSTAPFTALNAGTQSPLYVDVNGNICGAGGGGGGGSVTIASPLDGGYVAVKVENMNSNGQATMQNSQPVTIASDQSILTVNVNNANTNGQASSANSTPVVIASDQSGIPVTVSSGTITATVAAPVNITETNCSVTLTAGTTAQNAFTASSTKHGYRIQNIDTTHIEDVWFSTTTTAAPNTVASYRLAASPSANSTVQSSSYTSPYGEGVNTALSVVAATTGHLISCTYWLAKC